MRASRVVFHIEKSEEQELPVLETLATGGAVSGDEHGNDPAGKRL